MTTARGYVPNADVIRENPNNMEVLLFLDNISVIDDILGKTPNSSQAADAGLRKIAKELSPGAKTRVTWVPGHKDIRGNEIADTLAKEGGEVRCTNLGRHGSIRLQSIKGLELPRINSNVFTITHIRHWTFRDRKRHRDYDWESRRPPYYEGWDLDVPAAPRATTTPAHAAPPNRGAFWPRRLCQLP
ncbi:hypothetical protein GGI35DRAFT_484899 [Trichoderma velutinum]